MNKVEIIEIEKSLIKLFLVAAERPELDGYKIFEKVRPALFVTPVAKWLIETLKSLYKEREVLPDKKILKSHVQENSPEKYIEKVLIYIDKLDNLEPPIPEISWQYYKELKLAQVDTKTRDLWNNKIAPLLEKGSIEDVVKELESFSYNAKTFITDKESEIQVVDYKKDLENRINRIIHPETDKEIIVPFGISILDKMTDGGIRGGETAAFFAVTGGGKSIALQDVSSSALEHSLNALMDAVIEGTQDFLKCAYFSLEMKADEVAYRYDSRFSRIAYKRFRNKDLDEDALNQWKKAAEKIRENQLKIFMVPNNCSVRTIKEQLKKEKFKPDFIVIDYASLMVPLLGEYTDPNDWKFVSTISREIHELGLERRIPILTAFQLKPSVLEKEPAEDGRVYVTFLDIAQATGVAFNLDWAFAIVQTVAMQIQNIMELQIFKARPGAETKIITLNPNFNLIRLHDTQEYLSKSAREQIQAENDES